MTRALAAPMRTSLAALAARTSPLFAPALVLHLTAVIAAFAIALCTWFFPLGLPNAIHPAQQPLEQRARQSD